MQRQEQWELTMCASMDNSTSITWFTYILPTLYNAMYDLVTICTTANHSMVLITIKLPVDNRMTALECSDGDDNILKEKTNLLPLILISSILLDSKQVFCMLNFVLLQYSSITCYLTTKQTKIFGELCQSTCRFSPSH